MIDQYLLDDAVDYFTGIANRIPEYSRKNIHEINIEFTYEEVRKHIDSNLIISRINDEFDKYIENKTKSGDENISYITENSHNFNKLTVIYIISTDRIYKNYLYKIYSEAKNSGNGFVYSGFNEKNIRNFGINSSTNSRTALYVGKIEKNIINRLVQQLFQGHPRTSSLHMATWDWNENYDGDIDMGKIYVELDFFFGDPDREPVDFITQRLWSKKKPMFGLKVK
ncbi:hypothetical protein [uncultured Bartonella sp.]|uniref:hypothetical protein n=1 Tax=uncultured Bartonella sp. TaxID=104108 RepID=UPI0025E3A4E8|nr:hypothetical protein [uncultured Bartonella sp.]